MNENTNIPEIEMNELELTQETEKDVLQELADNDFTSDIDYDGYFNALEAMERDLEELKKSEAENVIDELGKDYIDPLVKSDLDKAVENIKTFLKKHDVNSDLVKNMSEPEKDKLFAICKFLIRNLSQNINNITFSINFTRKEYTLIKMIFRNRLEYSGKEIFNVIELKRHLDQWDKINEELSKDMPGFVAETKIKNIVMMYHFLCEYKVKGFTEEFYTFISILNKIGDTNKLYNAYNVINDRMNTDYMIWLGALEPTNQAENAE